MEPFGVLCIVVVSRSLELYVVDVVFQVVQLGNVEGFANTEVDEDVFVVVEAFEGIVELSK